MTGAWVIITVCVGIALDLFAGVPMGYVLGYDRACDRVARPPIGIIPAGEAEKER